MKTFLLIITQLLAVSFALSPEAISDTRRAFVPKHTTPGSTPPSNSRLYGSQGMALPPPAGTQMSSERVWAPAPAHHQLSSKVELPRRHLRSPFALQRAEMLVNTEMTLGRAAMVAAIVLFTVEIATGQSLPDQILALCSLHP